MSSGSPSASETAELHSQLFANVVMQQAGMVMIFLGVTPHPQTGKAAFDLESAQHFISQLEMLEAKTKGNLTAEESSVLKQSLTTVRMAFVQAVQRGAPPVESAEPATATATARGAEVADKAPASSGSASPSPERGAPAEAASNLTPDAASATSAASDPDRKKFVKKY